MITKIVESRDSDVYHLADGELRTTLCGEARQNATMIPLWMWGAADSSWCRRCAREFNRSIGTGDRARRSDILLNPDLYLR